MKIPRHIDVDGFRLPPIFVPEIFRAACKFKPKKDQIIVATYPKCGTTWTMQIVSLILRNGVPPADAQEYFSLQPFIEMTPLHELENIRRDSVFKTHLPFDRITFSEDSKYIYVARHPGDCVVSFYHHVRYFPTYFYSDGTFDDFFEVFVAGKNIFGDYFDHLSSWYERSNKPNVFFTTFEDLKFDSRGMILQIANFLGAEYYENLKKDDEKVLKKVLEYSSIGYMKSTVDRFWEQMFLHLPPAEVLERNSTMKNYADIFEEAAKAGHHSVGNFVRNGKVGDGKITLTENQKRRLENRINEKCAQSDVMDLWKNVS